MTIVLLFALLISPLIPIVYGQTTPPPTPAPGSSSGEGCCPNGKLSVNGTQLVGADGNPVQLRGMSLFWSNFPEGAPFFNEQTVQCLKCNWNADIVRNYSKF
jgi:hypothetical protein